MSCAGCKPKCLENCKDDPRLAPLSDWIRMHAPGVGFPEQAAKALLRALDYQGRSK